MNKIARKIVIAVIALITIISVSGITPVGAQTTTPTFNFIRNLTIGSTGEDVRALQRFLNARNFTVATTGPGSVGNETTRFGPRTRDALIRFQINNNISPARGFFGPITRRTVIALGTTITTPVSNFTRDLAVGSTGEDVRALQRFLNARNFTVATTGAGSPGNEATTFDLLTRDALERFQIDNNISPARGFFDSITRERVIALIASGAPGATVTPGVLSSIISPTTPITAIVPVGTTGRTDVVLTTVRYTATNEPVILQDITINQTGTATRTVFSSIEIVDGTRIIPLPIIPTTGDIIFRDVNIEIPTTGHRDIIVRADLAGISHGVTSGQTVKLDVNVTRARGRNSNANVTTGLGNIAGGNPMTIRQTIPTVTVDPAATLGVHKDTRGRIIGNEILRINVTADASGDVFLREISITPTIPGVVTFNEGIVVFQGHQQGAPQRGRIMHLGTRGIDQEAGTNDIVVGVGEVDKYQIGQLVRVVTFGFIDQIPYQRTIIGKDNDSILLSENIPGRRNIRNVYPAGFSSGHTYRIPLTGALIPRGTTSTFSVFTFLNVDIQVNISPDTSAGATGNFVWGEGINTPNINSYMLREFPITGPAVDWRGI